MNNRINEVRKMIKALRVTMIEAEAAMRGQIARDQDCTFVAQDLLNMRTVMAGLVREKQALGDHEPILVHSRFITRDGPKPPVVVKRPIRAQGAG